ncbi:hypothetical protein EMGR_001698 [Emarellia grisea]
MLGSKITVVGRAIDRQLLEVTVVTHLPHELVHLGLSLIHGYPPLVDTTAV